MSRITPVPIPVPNVEAFGVGGVQPGSPTPSPSTPLTPTKCIYIRVLSVSRSGRRNSPRGDRQGLDFPSTENIRQAPDILPWGAAKPGAGPGAPGKFQHCPLWPETKEEAGSWDHCNPSPFPQHGLALSLTPRSHLGFISRIHVRHTENTLLSCLVWLFPTLGYKVCKD